MKFFTSGVAEYEMQLDLCDYPFAKGLSSLFVCLSDDFSGTV